MVVCGMACKLIREEEQIAAQSRDDSSTGDQTASSDMPNSDEPSLASAFKESHSRDIGP